MRLSAGLAVNLEIINTHMWLPQFYWPPSNYLQDATKEKIPGNLKLRRLFLQEDDIELLVGDK